MAWETLRAYQDGLLNSFAVGTDLAVIRGEKQLYRHMNGFADREAGKRVDEDTLFRVYSMTKPITCVLALMLHDQGRFLMTDPLHHYLPAFEELQIAGPDGVREAEQPIRVLDLFTMTSGLSYDLERDSVKKMQQVKGRALRVSDLVEVIAREPLAFEPGSRFLYGLSHDVLGVLVETLCGKPLGECLRDMLFSPLGMEHSFFRLPERLEPHRAKSYASSPPFKEEPGMDQFFLDYPMLESGGGGLVMSMADYLRFIRFLLREGADEKGRHLLSPAAIRLMRSNHLSGEVLASYMAERPGYGYGLGVRVLVAPQAIGALTSPGEYGWAGAKGTWMMVDPTQNLAAVFMMQGDPGPNRLIHPRLRNLIAAEASQHLND